MQGHCRVWGMLFPGLSLLWEPLGPILALAQTQFSSARTCLPSKVWSLSLVWQADRLTHPRTSMRWVRRGVLMNIRWANECKK